MEPSLIQQRMEISRERIYAVTMLILGGLGIILVSFTLTANPSNWGAWLLAGVWLVMGGTGAAALRRYRRRMTAFEAEHGPDAGKQQ